jgi:hypothetical protein
MHSTGDNPMQQTMTEHNRRFAAALIKGAVACALVAGLLYGAGIKTTDQLGALAFGAGAYVVSEVVTAITPPAPSTPVTELTLRGALYWPVVLWLISRYTPRRGQQ